MSDPAATPRCAVIHARASSDRVFSGFERGMISQRTREALAEKRARGVQLGTPSKRSGETVVFICRAAYGGAPPGSIGADLEKAGLSKSSGGALWAPNAVRRVLDGKRGQAVTAQLEADDENSALVAAR